MTNADTENSDGGLTALVMQCAFAVLSGKRTITISASGKRPAGFPRGELLSIGTNGKHNYAVCPVKAMAWCHSRIQAALTKSQAPA